MVSVKGTSVAGRRQFVLRHYGEERFRAVLAQLKDRDAAQRLERGVLKSTWYPFDFWVDLTLTIDRVLGFGDGRLYREIAAQTAEDDLASVYKVYFKNNNPMNLFDKAAQLWSSYYSSGSLGVNKIAATTVGLEVLNFETPHWVHCETVIGWTHRGIELTGVKHVQAEHLECRGRGAERCRMRISWTA